MPLDECAPLPAVLPDLDPGKPSLRRLAYVLRHKEEWPEGFVWDYSDCEKCAIGMAHELWGEQNAEEAIDFDADALDHVFYSAPFEIESSLIRPEHIADLLDAYLASTETP